MKIQSKLTKNLSISVLAQIVSLLVGFIINLIVPKFIDEIHYAYWQTYVLYVGYVGIMHFGILDGIVLRYSKYDYHELDKSRVRSQFQILLFFNTVFSSITIIVSAIIFNMPLEIIIALVAVGIITKNAFTYSSYTFQITNRINKYALLTIIHRVCYGVLVLIFLILGVKNFIWFCVADLLSDVFAIIFAMAINKGLYFGKSLSIKETFKEAKINVSSGVLLLVANWSAILIVGMAKTIIQFRWDTLVFSKVSFAFSVSNLFLTFVTAVSVVLFPTLKRMKEEELPTLYVKIRNVISPLLFGALLFYFPGSYILKLWLPKYVESLKYLGIILPLIVYSSKVTLLTNTYLKAYRKEKLMFLINVFSAILGVLLFSISAYVINSLSVVLCSIILTVMINSIVSEIVVLKTIKQNVFKEFIYEALLAIAFILLTQLFSLLIAGLLFLAIYLIYLMVNYQTRTLIINKLFRRK